MCLYYSDSSRNNQHYALICTTPLFYILAPTCFGSSLPSSGSFLDPSELLKIQIEWVVYRIICGYVACMLECNGFVCCASISAYCWLFLLCLIMHGTSVKLLRQYFCLFIINYICLLHSAPGVWFFVH
jgi:hypothetical protein